MTLNKDKNDPIKHVILLILENHSFDQMLGCFQEIFPELDGVDKNNLRSNDDGNGNKISQSEMRETQMLNDPYHEHTDAMEQVANNNSGFVKNFVKHYPKSSQKERQAIMGFYPLDYLPALHTLARHFTICDKWFSSLLGPTWPNRFFALSGTCSGDVDMLPKISKDAAADVFSAQSQDTIFDRLEDAKRSWNVFYYDIPSSLLLKNMRKPQMSKKYLKIDDFFTIAGKQEQDFPEFVFIEPKYFGLDQNDDHPPHNIMKAQKLVADVYNAIRSNDDLWNSSLFILAYDEHGGFYDHVKPPKSTPPDNKTEKYSFDQYGFRVPAVLISPWVKRKVESTLFDHTSILKYLCEKWDMPHLTERDKNANSIGCAIGNEFNENTPQFIRIPYSSLISKNPQWELADESKHHNSFSKLANIIANDAEGTFGEGAELEALRATVKSEDLLSKIKSKIGSLLVNTGYKWSKQGSDKVEAKARNLSDVLLKNIK